MPLDFPNAPLVGQVWIASNGVAYVWDGTKWTIPAGSGGGGGGGTAGVSSFNFRTGAVLLTPADVIGALGYTPLSAINVKDHGAKGDGTTDDSAAIANAFAAAAAGGEIWFPAGNYVMASAVSQSFTGSVTVRGVGPGVSLLSCAANGIAINLASNQNATVRDLSIVTTTAAGVANTGLSVTAPDQSAQVWLENLRLRGNTGGTTGWQTSINIVGCGVPRIRGITVLTVNGSSTGTSGATCIAIAGVSSAANSDNYQISDCQLQGGLYGLYIGGYVEGVLLTNVVILGNDYAVYASASGNMLEFTNCHMNPGVCGVYANTWGFISIVSTFFLRFRATGNWTGIDLESSGEAAICACNFFGNNAGTEIGILVNNAVNTPVTITGNTFVRLGTACVSLTGTTQTAMVVGNNAGSMRAGSRLVSDSTGNASNQAVANSFNSVPDIDVSNNNLVVSGNGVQYLGLGGTAHVVGFTWDGNLEGYVDGSHTTTIADTNWVNSNFVKLSAGGTVTGPLIWTATGSSTPRAAQDRSADVLNIKDYILPTDADATAGFGRVMAQVQTLNRPITVYVPSGTYYISAPIAITLSGGMGVYLRGDGSANTKIYQTADADAIDVMLNNYGSNNLMGGGFAISGLTIFQADTGASTTRTALSVFGANVGTGNIGQLILIDDIYINAVSTSWWAIGINLQNLQNMFVSRVQGYAKPAMTTTHMVISGNAQGHGVYLAGFNLRDCVFTNGHIGVDLQNYIQGAHFVNLQTVGTVFSVNATPTSGINEEYQFVDCYLSGKVNMAPNAANVLGSVKFQTTYFDSLTMSAANDTQVLISNLNSVQITGCQFNGTGTRLANIIGLQILGSNPYEIIISNNLFGGYQNGGTGLSIGVTQRAPLCVGNSFLNCDNPVVDTSPGAAFVATRINYAPYLMGVGGTGVTAPAVVQQTNGQIIMNGPLTVANAGVYLNQPNQSLQMGSTTTAGTPYINFFSSGHTGYDSRILANGGTGNSDGFVNFYAGWVNFATTYGWGGTKQTVAAIAPGANNARLRFEVGTNAGTAKLVAYAGTSATGVTIMDNIGAGF